MKHRTKFLLLLTAGLALPSCAMSEEAYHDGHDDYAYSFPGYYNPLFIPTVFRFNGFHHQHHDGDGYRDGGSGEDGGSSPPR